jgi:hypothetical protein
MQWLQATFAARFSRFRSVSGHLFQGRYQALLIEDQEPLFQVANYIHLNPVRARVTFPEDIIRYEARQAEHLAKPNTSGLTVTLMQEVERRNDRSGGLPTGEAEVSAAVSGGTRVALLGGPAIGDISRMVAVPSDGVPSRARSGAGIVAHRAGTAASSYRS